MPGEVDQFIDNEFRPRYRSVTIEVWGLKTLADEICKLSRHKVEKIIDVIPDDEPAIEVIPLNLMKTGRDLWTILSSCVGWFEHVEPDDCTNEEQDLIDSVVQSLRDWSDIAPFIDDSRSSIRDAQRSIATMLDELAATGLALYAGIKHDHPFGGGPSPLLGSFAIFKVARLT